MRILQALFICLLLPSVAFADAIQDGRDAYAQKDWLTALKIFRPLAEQGNAEGQRYLAKMYEAGDGVPKSSIEAQKWALLAAQSWDKIYGSKYETEVLKTVWPYLRVAKKSGRIYYAVPCAKDDGYPYYPYPFPKLDLQAPDEGVSGLAAIKMIFHENQDVQVVEDPEGIIKIMIGKIPTAILQTKISSLKLTQLEQYHEWHAMRALEASKDIQAVVDKRSNNEIIIPFSILSGNIADDRPHLPSSLTNITFDDALDLAAQTFRGIVVFGTCTEHNWFKLYFTGGYDYYAVSSSP